MRSKGFLQALFCTPRLFRAALLTLLAAQASLAEEITPFKLTGIEGHVLVDYLYDGITYSQGGPGSGNSDQNQSNLREEIFIMTHSYVYHPNFLTLDIGGGPIRQDTWIDSNGDETSAGKTLYSFTGRATFLRDKPVRGTLFYDHLNPTVLIAPGEVMLQETDRYGLDFAMSSPKIGLPFNLSYLHTQTQGRGSRRIQDDELEQFNLNVSRTLGKLGSSSLQYQTTDQTSRSGSLDLPIQSTTTRTQGLNLNTQLQFGENNQYDFTNNIIYNSWQSDYTQGGSLPDQSLFSLLLDLRARPSNQLTLYGNYNQNRNDQGYLTLTTQSLSSGLSYFPSPDLETSLGARWDKNDSDQYWLRNWAVNGSIRHTRPLWLGSLQLSYGANYENRDQQASNPIIDVYDEPHILSGTLNVPLNNPNVVTGSIDVTNKTQSQTYVENVDYLVIVVGSQTSIQRVVTGDILDGEEVLVDYAYDIGGSYASYQLDQTFNLNWNVTRNVDAYFRWYDSSPELISGTPTYQLNSVRDVLLGMRAEVPIGFGFSVGGSYETQDRNETISPYTRQAGDVFLQSTSPILGLANFRLSSRRSIVNYENSDEDVDLTGYEMRVWARRFGIDLIGLANYEEDVGSPIHSKRRGASVNAVWRERKVTVTATFSYSHETQGDYERDHTLLRITGRRDF